LDCRCGWRFGSFDNDRRLFKPHAIASPKSELNRQYSPAARKTVSNIGRFF
jgi:hypothetical protein